MISKKTFFIINFLAFICNTSCSYKTQENQADSLSEKFISEYKKNLPEREKKAFATEIEPIITEKIANTSDEFTKIEILRESLPKAWKSVNYKWKILSIVTDFDPDFGIGELVKNINYLTNPIKKHTNYENSITAEDVIDSFLEKYQGESFNTFDLANFFFYVRFWDKEIFNETIDSFWNKNLTLITFKHSLRKNLSKQCSISVNNIVEECCNLLENRFIESENLDRGIFSIGLNVFDYLGNTHFAAFIFTYIISNREFREKLREFLPENFLETILYQIEIPQNQIFFQAIFKTFIYSNVKENILNDNAILYLNKLYKEDHTILNFNEILILLAKKIGELEIIDSEKQAILISLLKIIYEYNLPLNEALKFISLVFDLQENSSDNLLENLYKKVNRSITSLTYGASYELSPEEIAKEILELSSSRFFFKDYQALLDEFNKIKVSENNHISIPKQKETEKKHEGIAINFIGKLDKDESKYTQLKTQKIKNWTKNEIRDWAKLVKEKIISPNIYEKIAVIKRAVTLEHFTPRDTQIFALLAFLSKNNSFGRLLQVKTGQGKSIINVMLAIALSLKGETVDIMTSSSVLAKRDAKKYEELFSYFNLEVKERDDLSKPWECDIIYGTPLSLIGKILKDETSGYSIKKRQAENLIIDESDNSLYDSKGLSVRHTGPTPAMDHITGIITFIWRKTYFLASHTIKKGNKFVSILVDYKENGDTIDVNRNIDISQNLFAADGEENFYNAIKEYIGKSIDEELENPNSPIRCPKHLKDFIILQKNKWIESALDALLKFTKNIHYIVKDGKIVIVDHENTGTIQERMVWDNALTQMLQLKEGLAFRPEELSSTTFSLVRFVNRYKENVYGMTGTLGDSSVQDFFYTIYGSDSIIIPPYIKTPVYHNIIPKYLCKVLHPIILDDESKWQEEIACSAREMFLFNRSSLIICESIKKAKIIYEKVKEKLGESRKIFLYDGVNKFNKEAIDCQEFIIATNIAGRGADFIPSDSLKENGGPHVCLTFMPESERVEEQNLGRTARNGEKGTSQMIILSKEKKSIKRLQKEREEKEKLDRNNAIKIVKKEKIKDNLFVKYCELKEEIVPRNSLEYKKDIHKDLKNKWDEIKNYCLSDNFINEKLKLIKEATFADFLEKSKNNIVGGDEGFNITKILFDFMFEMQFDKETLKQTILKKNWETFCEIFSPHDTKILEAIKENKPYKPEENIENFINNKFGFAEADALNERWSMFIQKNLPHKGDFDETLAIEKFNEFKAEIYQDAKNNSIVKNPYYYVKNGQYYRAISMDEDFSAYARYLYATDLVLKNKSSYSSQKEAIMQLEEAAKLLETKYLADIQGAFMMIGNSADKKDLTDCFESKLIFIQDFLYAIQHSIHMIKAAQKDTENLEIRCDRVFKFQSSEDQKRTHLRNDINKSNEENPSWKMDFFDNHLDAEKEEKTFYPNYGEIEAYGNGFTHFTKLKAVQKEKEKSWGNIICCFLIGAAQIVGGVIMMATGYGKSVGLELIKAGWSDIKYAFDAAVGNCEFSWSDYGKKKLMDLANLVSGLLLNFASSDIVKNFLPKGFNDFVEAFVPKNAIPNFDSWQECLNFGGKSILESECMNGLCKIGQGVYDLTAGRLLKNVIYSKVYKTFYNTLQSNNYILGAIDLDNKLRQNYWENIILSVGKEELSHEVIPKSLGEEFWSNFAKSTIAKTSIEVAFTVENEVNSSKNSSPFSIDTSLESISDIKRINVIDGIFKISEGYVAISNLDTKAPSIASEISKKFSKKYKKDIEKAKEHLANNPPKDATNKAQEEAHELDLEDESMAIKFTEAEKNKATINQYRSDRKSSLVRIADTFSTQLAAELSREIDEKISYQLISEGASLAKEMISESVEKCIKENFNRLQSDVVEYSRDEFFSWESIKDRMEAEMERCMNAKYAEYEEIIPPSLEEMIAMRAYNSAACENYNQNIEIEAQNVQETVENFHNSESFPIEITTVDLDKIIEDIYDENSKKFNLELDNLENAYPHFENLIYRNFHNVSVTEKLEAAKMLSSKEKNLEMLLFYGNKELLLRSSDLDRINLEIESNRLMHEFVSNNLRENGVDFEERSMNEGVMQDGDEIKVGDSEVKVGEEEKVGDSVENNVNNGDVKVAEEVDNNVDNGAVKDSEQVKVAEEVKVTEEKIDNSKENIVQNKSEYFQSQKDILLKESIDKLIDSKDYIESKLFGNSAFSPESIIKKEIQDLQNYYNLLINNSPAEARDLWFKIKEKEGALEDFMRKKNQQEENKINTFHKNQDSQPKIKQNELENLSEDELKKKIKDLELSYLLGTNNPIAMQELLDKKRFFETELSSRKIEIKSIDVTGGVNFKFYERKNKTEDATEIHCKIKEKETEKLEKGKIKSSTIADSQKQGNVVKSSNSNVLKNTNTKKPDFYKYDENFFDHHFKIFFSMNKVSEGSFQYGFQSKNGEPTEKGNSVPYDDSPQCKMDAAEKRVTDYEYINGKFVFFSTNKNGEKVRCKGFATIDTGTKLLPDAPKINGKITPETAKNAYHVICGEQISLNRILKKGLTPKEVEKLYMEKIYEFQKYTADFLGDNNIAKGAKVMNEIGLVASAALTDIMFNAGQNISKAYPKSSKLLKDLAKNPDLKNDSTWAQSFAIEVTEICKTNGVFDFSLLERRVKNVEDILGRKLRKTEAEAVCDNLINKGFKSVDIKTEKGLTKIIENKK